MSNRAKLKRFKDQSKKAYTENVNEVVDELQFERELAKPRPTGVNLNAIKRVIRQEIPDSTRKWLEANGHGDLWPKYRKWVKSVAVHKNRLASKLANELGLDLEKEHWTPVAGMGDIPPKMPYTSVSDRGPDSEGGTGSGKFNRRVGNKPVFQRKVLQQLGVATNWQESVANFVADRPDIKDVAERNKLKLPPLPVRKPSNLALLKLQQKDFKGSSPLNQGDQLESMMDLEYDLKKSGIISSKNDASLLHNYLDKINTKETVIHAEKHSWQRNNEGELILDQNNKPIPSGEWDLTTKKAHRYKNEWFTKRKADSINAVKRQNPKFTKLPSERHIGELLKNSGLSKIASKTQKADLAAQTGFNIASGNVPGAVVSGSILSTQVAMQSPAVQKKYLQFLRDIATDRAGKTAKKFMPGLDVAISGKESWDYLRQGKFDQAGIAALSGAIGWIPGKGDLGAALLDSANTGLDIARFDWDNAIAEVEAEQNKKKLNNEVPTTKTKTGIPSTRPIGSLLNQKIKL